MITKPIEAIKAIDFQELIDNGVSESKTIEYKQILNLKTDNDKKEFLADVSSFANASGGDLIFGISEDKGIPKSIEGIELGDPDQTLLQIESLLRDGIKPRIMGIDNKTFNVSGNKFIILIRIHKSWASPHQVILKGSDKFYSRGTNGKYKLDIEELRSAFAFTEKNTEQIRNFVAQRIGNIVADETPVLLANNGKIALHLIPFSSFAPGKKFDIASKQFEIKNLRPLDGGSRTPRFNLDGILSASLTPGQSNTYVQFFRNGIIETVNAELLFPHFGRLGIPSVKGRNYEWLIVEIIEEYLEAYKKIQIDLPIYLFLSLINVKGYFVSSDLVRAFSEPININKDVFTLPEVIINSLDDNIPFLLKPAFDTIWNSCGYERSFSYDADGNWKNYR